MAVRLSLNHGYPSRTNPSTHAVSSHKAQIRNPSREYRVHASSSSYISPANRQKTSPIETISKIEKVRNSRQMQNQLNLTGSKIPKAEEIAKNPLHLKKLAEDYLAQAQEEEAHEITEFCMGMFRDSLIKTTPQKKAY